MEQIEEIKLEDISLDVVINKINSAISCLTDDEKELVSDGYHTFKELYDHRCLLYLTLANLIDKSVDSNLVWKSKLHQDGSGYEGWFVLGIGKKEGRIITYHLPNDLWDKAICPEIEKGIYDGHSSNDVLNRLKEFNLLFQE